MHGTIQVAAIWLVTGAWVAARYGWRGLAPPPGSALPLAGGAVAASLGYGLQLAAYQATLVALAEGLKRVTGLLAALAVGRIMFGEPVTRPKTIGVAVLAVGVPLILLS
jgi:multidrug transporter EmrE-like cation transporter